MFVRQGSADHFGIYAHEFEGAVLHSAQGRKGRMEELRRRLGEDPIPPPANVGFGMI
jgi:hypothetical protein